MHKRSTLEDVARLASVSKATASLSLNGKATNKIPLATRERVLAAANTLEFQPHGVARALVRRRADVLGVVCTLNPFTDMAHHGFEQALLSALFHQALERGYNPMIYGAPGAESEYETVSRYADGRSDAFILLYPEAGSVLLERLPRLGIPVVSICHRIDGGNWVDSDHVAGIRAALEHLIALGHRRIAYLIGPDVDGQAHGRVVGFRDTLVRSGLMVREDWIVPYSEEFSTGQQIRRFFAESEPPTALLAWNDFAAGEVYKAVYEQGRRIPEDVSVIGFDDIPAARLALPPLTTIRQDVMRMARSAVDLAIDSLTDKSRHRQPSSVVCPIDLILRESATAPMRDSR